MAGYITASDAVARTRRYSAILDTGTYRDGFSTDVSTVASLIPILFFENLAVRILCDTGIVLSDHLIPSTSGNGTYTYPSGIGKVVEMSYQISGQDGLRAKILREVTPEDLRSRDRYYAYTGGEPAVFATIGPKFILYPVPNGSPYAPGPIGITGHKLIADMTLAQDVPVDLPLWYHEAYPLLAAIILLSSDDSPSRQGRIEPLSQLFAELYPRLQELVTSRARIKWVARAEGGSVERRMMQDE